jgi:hypothetical protein
MEELYHLKNDFRLKFEAKSLYKKVTNREWNGRDSDELCDFKNVQSDVFNGMEISVYRAVPCPNDTVKKKDVIKQVNSILDSAYMPKYDNHVKVDAQWELFCSFEIEDAIKIPLWNNCIIHSGIKGYYPEKYDATSPHFNVNGELWSSGNDSEPIDQIIFDLAVAALEELSLKIDERYI